MELGELLKTKRFQKFLTQEELAELVGIKRCHYNQIETGKQKPSLKTLKKLVEVLNITDKELNKIKE